MGKMQCYGAVVDRKNNGVEFQPSIIYASNATKVWSEFKELFDKSNLTQTYRLWKMIGSLTQGTYSATAYYSKMKDLWDEMDLLVAGPGCDCKETRPFIEQFKNLRLLQFLVSLNESYVHVRNQVLLKTPVLIVNQAYTLVIQEESQRTLGIGKSNSEALTMLAEKKSNIHSGFQGKETRVDLEFIKHSTHTGKFLHRGSVQAAAKSSEKIMHRFWGECVKTVVYLLNKWPTSVLKGKSPHELLYNKPPDIDHLRVFGCLCYVSNLPRRDKFSPRENRSVLVGYSTTQKGYTLYDLERKVFLVSKDVSFREDVFPFKNVELDSAELSLKQPELLEPITLQPHDDDDNTQQQVTRAETFPEAHENQITISLDAVSIETLTSAADALQDNLNDTAMSPQQPKPSTQQPQVQEVAHDIKRGGRISKPPIWLKDYLTTKSTAGQCLYPLSKGLYYGNLKTRYQSYLKAFTACIEPSSFKEAVQDDRWVEAMHQEI
nr:uncharacterized protein LOC117274513 [Nicotiana tomentosiformis]